MNLRLRSISGMIQRHLLIQFRDLYRIIDSFYWPIFDMLLWGYMSEWVSKKDGTHSPVFMISVLGGIFLWNILYRASLEVSVNVVEENWSRNLINLFSTPMSIWEWLAALLTLGIIRVMITILVCAGAVWLLWSINLFNVGTPLVWCIIMQLISGWIIGIFSASLFIYWGYKVQSLPWPLGWFFAPFSGVFYPVEVLPLWMQKMSTLLPMAYTFRAWRGAVVGEYVTPLLVRALMLNVVYFIAVCALFAFMFKRSKIHGLAQLEH